MSVVEEVACGGNVVRLFGVLYVAAFLFVQAFHTFDQRRFIRSSPPVAQRAHVLGLPLFEVSPTWALRCGLLLLGTLATALLGLLLGIDGVARLSLLSSFVLLAAYYKHVAALGYVIRKILFAPVVFAVLALAPGLGDAWSAGTPVWPLTVLQVYAALIYATTGIEKVLEAPRAWWNGEVLRWHLVEHHLWGDMPLGLRVAQNRLLCRVGSITAVVWEVTFPLVLIFEPLVLPYVAYGLGFHAGTSILMRIDYHRYWFMNYLVFLPAFLALVGTC